nr:MAG TPA: hypothetical protein [Caudoviricetes sp.]
MALQILLLKHGLMIIHGFPPKILTKIPGIQLLI